MATLSVLRFSSPDGVEACFAAVEELKRRGALDVRDVGIVTWARGTRLPEARQITTFVDSPALSEVFWSTLFSLAFFIPLATTAAGASPRPGDCSLSELGIDDVFVRCIRDRITEGTSGLFLLTPDATVDRVISHLGQLQFTVMSTNLTNRQEHALRSVFASRRETASYPSIADPSIPTLTQSSIQQPTTKAKGGAK